MPKKYEKITGPGVFVKAWLKGTEEGLLEAFRKEAAREVGEMERWMKDQIENDPINMLDHFAEEVFPMVRKAVKYRSRIYNRNRSIELAKFGIMEANATGDAGKIEDAVEAVLKLEDEQVALAWRIKKINIKVKRLVRLQIAKDEVDPFEEYEYEAEMI